MARYVFTDPQLEAVKAVWEAGSVGLPDERWVAVQVALERPPPSGRGAVEVDLDDAAEADLRSGFAAGFEGVDLDAPAYLAMADAMAGVAQILDVGQLPSYGR